MHSSPPNNESVMDPSSTVVEISHHSDEETSAGSPPYEDSQSDEGTSAGSPPHEPYSLPAVGGNEMPNTMNDESILCYVGSGMMQEGIDESGTTERDETSEQHELSDGGHDTDDAHHANNPALVKFTSEDEVSFDAYCQTVHDGVMRDIKQEVRGNQQDGREAH